MSYFKHGTEGNILAVAGVIFLVICPPIGCTLLLLWWLSK